MIILLSIVFFILGFALRDILTYLYKINKTIKQAEEIVAKEQKRSEFKKKYDFSDSFDSDSEDNDNTKI